jgi:hypothetical protein
VKTTIQLARNPNPLFAGVASIIAKGEPPGWLVIALEHFSLDIGDDISRDDRKRFENAVEQMHNAADVLLKWLPMYQHMGLGIQCPPEVDVVLDALPAIKTDLERLNSRRTGRPPDVRREICAAVVVEAWKMIHRKAEPYSNMLWNACAGYWRACGGGEIGETDDISNWRRPVEIASVTNHEWVRSVFWAVQIKQ